MPSWNTNAKVYRKYLESIVEMYKSRQDLKAYLELILTAVAAIIFVVFAIRPTFVTIAKLYKEKGEKEKVIKTMEQKRQNLQKAESNFNSYQQQINLLDKVMPKTPKPNELVAQIEGISYRAGILILSHEINEVALVKTTEPAPEGTPQSFEINLTITGEYSQVYQFINDLENFRRPFNFKLVSLRLSEDASDEIFNDIIANLSLEAYYYE